MKLTQSTDKKCQVKNNIRYYNYNFVMATSENLDSKSNFVCSNTKKFENIVELTPTSGM